MPAIYASMRSASDVALYPSMGEAPPVVVPNAPTGVAATPTGGTTATFSLTDTNAGTATYRWQISLVGSGTWADAVGVGSNPGAATAFSATGGTPATEWLVRARGETGAGDSAWVQAASSFWFDNTGTGGGVIGAADVTAPTLTGTIAITALTSTGYTATCPAASDAVGVTGYQWRLGGAGAWTDIAAGGRTATFTGRTPASTDSLEMRARDASGNFSPALTTSITLLGVAPAVTTQPSSASVAAGATSTFTAAFSGTPTPTRQWFRNGAAISGATGLSYSLATVLGDTGAIFTCTATNSAGTISTNAVTLTVTATATAPSIATQPASQTVAEGSPVTFSVVAAGTTPIAYQWSRNGVAITGATSSSYTLTPALGDSGATFSVYISNAAGNVTSSSATLAVTPALATMALESALDRILPYANGCPDQTAVFHLRQAAIEFFHRTQAWKQRLTPISTVVGQDAYYFNVPAGAAISKVLRYEYNGTEASVVDGGMGQSLQIYQSGADAVWTDDRMTFTVSPTPAEAGKTMTFQVSLKPTQAAATLPAAMWEQYIHYIAYGALARVLDIPAQTFTDPTMARTFRAAFEDAVNRVGSSAAKNTSRATRRVRGSFF